MTEKEVQEQDLTPFNFAGDQTEPGPRPGVGGWGLPGNEGSRPATVKLPPILGYSMDKIIRSFGLLRGITLEGDDLQKSLQNLNVARPGASVKVDDSQRKEALAALEKAKKALAREDANPLMQPIIINEDLLHQLKTGEKVELLSLLAGCDVEKRSNVQSALMHVLRSCYDRDEFNQIVGALGGASFFLQILFDHNLGTFCATAEFFGAMDWTPPFHHDLFTGEGDLLKGSVSSDNPLETLNTHLGGQEDTDSFIRPEEVERFYMGDITASSLMGFSRDDLYAIAQRGYDLLQEGKLESALSVFDGLVYLDPYDPYFYTVLGSVRQKQGAQDDAVACYSMGIKLQAWNINALANRGEILFNQGRLTEALTDFQKVLYYDPEDANPSTLRTKALLLAIKESVEAKAKESGEAEG